MRVKITMACTECKQRNYDTKKNKKNDPDRLEMKKYCRFCRKHTLHKESKQEASMAEDTKVVKDEAKVKEQKASKPAKKKGKIKKAWREFKAEFKKIVWSSKRSTFNNTVLVIVSMIIVSVVIGLLDFGFSQLLTWLGTLFK